MQNQNTDYSPVIEELNKAYKNYIIAKDALIELGTLTITIRIKLRKASMFYTGITVVNYKLKRS